MLFLICLDGSLRGSSSTDAISVSILLLNSSLLLFVAVPNFVVPALSLLGTAVLLQAIFTVAKAIILGLAPLLNGEMLLTFLSQLYFVILGELVYLVSRGHTTGPCNAYCIASL